MHDPEAPPAPDPAGTPDDANLAARRAALRKLAVLGAWTAPVTLSLLVYPRTSAASCPIGDLPPCDPGGNP